jgi:hypothetical protein
MCGEHDWVDVTLFCSIPFIPILFSGGSGSGVGEWDFHVFETVFGFFESTNGNFVRFMTGALMQGLALSLSIISNEWNA